MYLVIILVLLIILLQFKIFPDIISFLTIFLILFLLSNDLLISLIISCIVYGILFLIKKRNEQNFMLLNEGFENEKSGHDKETKKRVQHLKKIINKLENGISLNEYDLKENNTIKDYDFDNSKENEDDDKIASKKSPSSMTAHEAQKQTYKLIDTVQQLTETMKNLEPTLKSGQDILDKLETYKIKIT